MPETMQHDGRPMPDVMFQLITVHSPSQAVGVAARLGVPGYRVFRWERHWHTEGQPFRDPLEYPRVSVATSGTHDTEPMILWWERATEDERRKVGDLALIQRLAGGADIPGAPYETVVRDVLLEALCEAQDAGDIESGSRPPIAPGLAAARAGRHQALPLLRQIG